MIKKRSILISGHATSLTLEDEFWDALKNIAKEKEVSLPNLIASIDQTPPFHGNLSSKIRVFILQYYIQDT